MSRETIEQALPGAIRRATAAPTTTGEGWTVRILGANDHRDVRLVNQKQVARLTLELERLGYVLQVDDTGEADFVFEHCEMVAATG